MIKITERKLSQDPRGYVCFTVVPSCGFFSSLFFSERESDVSSRYRRDTEVLTRAVEGLGLNYEKVSRKCILL